MPTFSTHISICSCKSGTVVFHLFRFIHQRNGKIFFAVLAASDMDKTDIIDVLAIVTDHDQVANYRIIRDQMLNNHKCASTLLICGLGHPDWKVEIAVKAAKVD